VKVMAVATAALLTSGCIVVSLQPAYNDESIAFEEALIGQWENVEDRTSAIIDRAEWRAYKIVYTERSTTLAFHGNLTRIGETLFLDLTQVRGIDEGPYLIPVHGIYRIELEGDTLCASALDYQWFSRAMARKRIVSLMPAFDGRRNIALSAATGPLRGWLARAPAEVYTAPMTFTRKQ
jgi:hypothetical protein